MEVGMKAHGSSDAVKVSWARDCLASFVSLGGGADGSR